MERKLTVSDGKLALCAGMSELYKFEMKWKVVNKNGKETY